MAGASLVLKIRIDADVVVGGRDAPAMARQIMDVEKAIDQMFRDKVFDGAAPTKKVWVVSRRKRGA